MTCKQCDQAVIPKRIKRPDDLSKAIIAAASAIKAGVLKYEGTGAWGDPFKSIADGGAWGDLVNNYFSCTACGQWFNLRADTYHGSGGAFEAVAKPAEQIQTDAYPT